MAAIVLLWVQSILFNVSICLSVYLHLSKPLVQTSQNCLHYFATLPEANY